MDLKYSTTRSSKRIVTECFGSGMTTRSLASWPLVRGGFSGSPTAALSASAWLTSRIRLQFVLEAHIGPPFIAVRDPRRDDARVASAPGCDNRDDHPVEI